MLERLQKDICEEMNISYEKYRELFDVLKHKEKFGRISVLDFYNSLYGRWKAFVSVDISEYPFADFVIKSDLKCCYCRVL